MVPGTVEHGSVPWTDGALAEQGRAVLIKEDTADGQESVLCAGIVWGVLGESSGCVETSF